MSGSRHNKYNLSSYKQLIAEIEQQYRDVPKKGYSGPIPIISYDTNCINARQRMLAMNELERLKDEGWVDLRKSNVVLNELDNNSDRVSKACKTISIGGEELTISENEELTLFTWFVIWGQETF